MQVMGNTGREGVNTTEDTECVEDRRLNRLLNSVINEVKHYADDQNQQIRKLTQIGLALSAQKNIKLLLELIVDEARDLSHADAGTLYILDPNRKHLRFEILQNNSLNTRLGGTGDVLPAFPHVPLYIEGQPNHSNVCTHVAIDDEIVNIPDVYEAEGFDFTGPRKYDEATGYRSKSMLVIPMKNHENDIIGVLQLLNAQDPDTGEVIGFSDEYVDLVGSLASQAAVALDNAQLIQDLKDLLDAFIRSIATAIDEKSPYTGGHITRVVDLSMMIAEQINNDQKGPYKDVFFDEDQKEELRMAAWMHDVGKITTPEWVVDKSTKLSTVGDRIEMIEVRFGLIAKSLENDFLQQYVERGQVIGGVEFIEGQQKLRVQLEQLKEDFDLIKACNLPGEYMSDDKIERIRAIATQSYRSGDEQKPYLTPEEVESLSIRKGSLSGEERKIIENHATMTHKILTKLPFPKTLANVPRYAAGHHEKLDGSGYPDHLGDEDLPIQARIMAIADIFEALTAKDRPYKKPMKLSQAIRIMGFMEKDRHIDPQLFKLFIDNDLHYEYARKEMNPDQNDLLDQTEA